jgi:hypothetical protein
MLHRNKGVKTLSSERDPKQRSLKKKWTRRDPIKDHGTMDTIISQMRKEIRRIRGGGGWANVKGIIDSVDSGHVSPPTRLLGD